MEKKSWVYQYAVDLEHLGDIAGGRQIDSVFLEGTRHWNLRRFHEESVLGGFASVQADFAGWKVGADV